MSSLLMIMNSIHDFMFTKKRYLALKKVEIEKQRIEKPPAAPQKRILNIHDKFFWCYYVLKYGFLKYEMIGKDHFKFKMEECLKIINSQEKKDKYLESELINEKKISLKSFLKLCKKSNINVCLKKKFMLNEHIFDPTKGVNIIDMEDFSISKESIDATKYWKIDDIEKPLKAFSNYKAQELRDIGQILKLDIMNGKKFKTKKQIYTMILSKIE